MTCELCAGKGIIRIGYHEPPSEGFVDYGICACRTGMRFRAASTRAMIAGRYGVSLDQVNLIEELLDPEELPEWMVPTSSDDLDVSEAGRTVRKAKL